MEHSHHDHAHHMEEFKKKFIIATILTIPVLLLSETIQLWLGFSFQIPYQKYVVLALSSIIYFYAGMPFLKGSYNELKARQPGMMTLVASAISVAYFYSVFVVFTGRGREFFWELATLIDVMLLGHWIEAKSVLGASKALEELAKLMPTYAHLIKNGEVVDVSVEELKVGDIVLVKPGEKIPSDGVIIEGSSFVNEALLTGESKPVSKKEGDKVIAGSINGEGSLKVKVEKTGKDIYLAQVMELVKQAQQSKSRTQDLANKAASLLFYVALISGIITYSVWSFYGMPDAALERTVTVLVIACPHALGLAIPLVVAISTAITAKQGILIRNRKAFEEVKDVDVVVFDKTGTLTLGELEVSDVWSKIDEKELLSYAASLEVHSEHIIGRAIVDYAKKKGIEIKQVNEFKAIPGKGVFGIIDGKEIYVGSEELLKDLELQETNEKIKEWQSKGKSIIFVVVNKEVVGAFALEDKIREESLQAVEKLKEIGIKVYMITGDAEEVAKDVATRLGIDNFFARVLPDQKANKIKELQEKGYKVAMVGDGINDAPALMQADVGIAIGAGTDVAIESADIILVRNNPLDVVKIIKIARSVYSKMVQNLWWAAGYNIIAIPLAAGILANYGIIISPAIGAILMSLSTIIVAINAQTLRKLEPKTEVKEVVYRDVVCGMNAENSDIKFEYENIVYHFCSENCLKEFKKNPKKYLKGGSEHMHAHHH